MRSATRQRVTAQRPRPATRKSAGSSGATPQLDSRQRLLNQAAHLFLTGGFQGVGIAELCATANVQKGTFYHFFESKTHLLLEVIERHVAEINEAINVIAAKDAVASRKIVSLFTMGQPGASDKAHAITFPGYFLGNIVLELASQNPPVQEATRLAFALWTRSIAQIVTQLIAEEKLYSLDAQDAAEAVLGLLQGGAVMANAYRDPRKMRAFAHTALVLLRAAGANQ